MRSATVCGVLCEGIGEFEAAAAELEGALVGDRKRYSLRMETCGAHSPRLLRAQAELLRLHAEEIARICARASRGSGQELDSTALAGGVGVHRGDVTEALAACELDGVRASTALRELLAALCSPRPESRPDALEFARAAVALRASSRHELGLVRLLRARGRDGEAFALAARCLARHPASPVRAELVGLLAELLEQRGWIARARLLRASA